MLGYPLFSNGVARLYPRQAPPKTNSRPRPLGISIPIDAERVENLSGGTCLQGGERPMMMMMNVYGNGESGKKFFFRSYAGAYETIESVIYSALEGI